MRQTNQTDQTIMTPDFSPDDEASGDEKDQSPEKPPRARLANPQKILRKKIFDQYLPTWFNIVSGRYKDMPLRKMTTRQLKDMSCDLLNYWYVAKCRAERCMERKDYRGVMEAEAEAVELFEQRGKVLAELSKRA